MFQMYDADGATRPFANCDPTGKFAEGKDQPLLRSKVAVARYLERAGVDASDVEKQDNAIREAKERAEAAHREAMAAREAADAAEPPEEETPDDGAAAAEAEAPVASAPSAAIEPVAASVPVTPATRRERVDALVDRFDRAIAHCLHCVFGVQIGPPLDRNCREEGGGTPGFVSYFQTRTPMELWRNIEPYAQTLGATRGMLKALDRVRRMFPPSTASPAGGDPVERYLESRPDFDEEDVDDEADGELGVFFGDDASEKRRREWERRAAEAALERAPPAMERLVIEDEDEDDEDDAEAVEDEGEAGEKEETRNRWTAVGAEAMALDKTEGASVDASPGGDAGAAAADASPSGEAGGAAADASPPAAAPVAAAGSDPAAEFATVHKTLHGFLARVADAAENRAAYDVPADSFSAVMDALRACIPGAMTGEAAAAAAAATAPNAGARRCIARSCSSPPPPPPRDRRRCSRRTSCTIPRATRVGSLWRITSPR